VCAPGEGEEEEMSDLVIRGGRVIDPAQDRDGVADVLIRDGRVAEIGSGLLAGEELDATDRWVVPGLIDLHVHLREPGGEAKETIATGARAAARGGFACVLAMPNTTPACDKGYLVRYTIMQGRESGGAEVLVAAALTEGRAGERPSNAAGLARAGAVALTDDGDEVGDARVMLVCLKDAARVGLPVLVHAEEPSLVGGGVMNAGGLATKLGLPGRSALSEEVAVERDIRLARSAGCRLHVQHISVRGALEMVRAAKADGAQITCEVTPHHLVLTEDECASYDSVYKVNPPLRSAADRDALVAGLADGTIDAIATDHAPHTAEEKKSPFDAAPSGMIGLETALGIVMTDFVGPGTMSAQRLVELMSLNPARILGSTSMGTLGPGALGHVTVIDPASTWTVDPDGFESKARNTPFAGRKLTGRAVATVVAGKVAWRADS
jgi:dihydroorotase